MSDKSTPLLAVLQLLRKYDLKVHAFNFKLFLVYKHLLTRLNFKKYLLLLMQGTEEILRKEANLGDAEYENLDLPEVELASILTAHHTESDPYSYEFAYESLKKFVENSLDIYKVTCVL